MPFKQPSVAGEMRVLDCPEQGPIAIEVASLLDDSGRLRLSPEVETGDFFRISLSKGKLTLHARGYVGFVPVTERVVVRVVPRVPIGNLARMARIADHLPTVLSIIRGYTKGEDWSDSLASLYASALTSHIDTISANGMLRSYQRHEEPTSFPRGRLLVHQTVQRLNAHGIEHKAESAWFERSVNNSSNQCLKYAIWLLARHFVDQRNVDKNVRRLHRKLNAQFSLFAGVDLDHGRRFMQDPLVAGKAELPTLRSYYRDALNVAAAVVEGRGVLIDSDGGAVQLPSLVLNMDTLFENYVRATLTSFALERQWSHSVLDGNGEGSTRLFDNPRSYKATPDVVVRSEDGRTALVIEIKNVAAGDFSKRDAINQAVTYAVRYGCVKVVLAHPRGSDSFHGLRSMGYIGPVEVYQYHFDLNSSDPVEEDQRFGQAVQSLLAPELGTG
ncbi:MULTISPECIES: McrC family protein [unclassified Micromonospora]|uniref:McrC family protein n=1 Tax=unclassified Micromonospora TaxID=2617518 RepID=UPI001C23EF21|nr:MULTISPECIES: McrC family protein [unclassified Micromonospora]MBU8857413.1 McrC family protein [Micromonospora sp. WMMB482]MDM4783036.1 McrC family protein [Micromonospora sp. b486]